MTLTGSAFRGAARTAAIVVLMMPAAITANCEHDPSPLSASVAIGTEVVVQHGGLALAATLKDADGPGGPEGEDARFFELSITARSGNFVFFPSLLKYYGSKDVPPEPADAQGERDEAPVLILQGATKPFLVSISNPASGPNGVLMVAFYDQDATRLATWGDY